MNRDILKEVMNKIDYNLKEKFENVEITRLDDKKEITFLVKAHGLMSNVKNKAEMVMFITESGISDNSVIWEYKTNPVEENSILLKRTSTIATLVMDIEDVVKENRFTKEYNDSLLQLINESKSENIKEGIKYRVTNIEYDTDGEDVDLPNELIIDVPSDITDTDEIDDYISDEISNETGFLHKGYSSDKVITIDEKFEFDLEEDVMIEGVKASVMDREVLEVGDVRYNVYELYVEGVAKSVFEYDITKK